MEKDTEKNGINSGRDPITGKFVEGNKLGGKIKSMLIDGVSVDKYYSHYAHCDIALVPLCDTVFNSYKTNLS